MPSTCRHTHVVVFSQHGTRDIPSQLSGGDLDGDLYNVVFDRRLITTATYQAADYPRVSAEELDRAVISKDMSDFFIQFMESDLLGMLSNIHMQLADQHELGTFEPACIKLAGLASIAVDFSKTSIPVNMMDCPRHIRCRPDFMAPSPRVIVSDQGALDLEEDDNLDDDAFEGLDIEPRSIHYYESQKVLGQLYRAIDERRFLTKMQQDQHAIMARAGPSNTMLETLLAYMKRQASQSGVLYQHHSELAAEIRAG